MLEWQEFSAALYKKYIKKKEVMIEYSNQEIEFL